MYPKGHPFYATKLKIRWKTDDKQTELKLICDFEESTHEPILIERHCMFFCMLSINKQANKNGEKIPVFLVIDTLMQLIKVI